MPITVENQRIRIALDLTQWLSTPKDIITSASPLISNGSDLQVEIAFSYGTLTDDSQLADMTNWASVQLSLKDTNDRDGGSYWSKTLSNADLNPSLTFAAWEAGTAQHCVIPITNAQNNLIFLNTTQTYWLVVQIMTGDSPAKKFAAVAFPVIVTDSGILGTPPSSVTPDLYYTQAESDARYLMTVDLSAKANLAGATFTGAVILASGQMSGATGLYATTKDYVDAGDAAVASASVPNTGTSTIAGAKTFSSLLTASAGLTTAGTVTIGSLSGVLKASTGVVSGSATTSDLTEGSNLYFTNARAIASTLTGYTATSGTISATDTLLQAIQKVGYALANTFSGATIFSGTTTGTMTSASTANKGDFGFIAGTVNMGYVFNGVSYSSLSNWLQIPYPVTSVNTLTGALTLTTTNIAEGTNLYHTSARVSSIITASTGVAGGLCGLDGSAYVAWANLPPLTGYISGAGTVSATDTLLQAIQKLNGNAALLAPLAGATFTGDVILSTILKMGSNKVIDGSNYFYDSAGHQILAARQTKPTALSLSGTYLSDYAAIQAWTAAIQTILTTHGLTT